MKALWSKGAMTASEIVEELAKQTRWNPKTIKTLIYELLKKGALHFEKEGREYMYSAAVRQDKYIREKTKSFVRRVYSGAMKPMLAEFLEDPDVRKGLLWGANETSSMAMEEGEGRMKRIITMFATIAFGVIVCGAAFCERGRTNRPREQERADRPRERDVGDARPEREEVRRLTERLRVLNQQLRGPVERARQNEQVRRAFARVRELQAALNQAQARANAMVDMAVAQRNARLIPLIRERYLIQKRLEELRSQAGDRRERASGPDASRERGGRQAPRTERGRER